MIPLLSASCPLQVQALMQVICHYESLTVYIRQNVWRGDFERKRDGRRSRKVDTLSLRALSSGPSTSRAEVRLLIVKQRVTLHSAP
jgi:hypothetical protein